MAGIDGWSVVTVAVKVAGLVIYICLEPLLCPERELAISQAEKYEAQVSNNICDSKAWEL